MQKSYDSLKDNDIEVILLAYLLKHPELLDTHFEQISNNLFSNPENLKIFKVPVNCIFLAPGSREN